MIDLPYPHRYLWPNHRPRSHFALGREVKKHKEWAFGATRAAFGPYQQLLPERLQFLVTVYPKPTGPLPDKDNTSAAMKAYLDGIAMGLGINDRRFDEPRIQFGERCKNGRVVFTLMEAM